MTESVSPSTAESMSPGLSAIRRRAVDRPRFRGRLHAWCFWISLPVGMALVVSAPTRAAAFAAFAFAYGVTAMLGVSALFHLTDFNDRQWLRFRRLDHVGIYFCIAGGYTPFGLIALDGWIGPTLLVAGWTGAAVGTTLRFLPFEPPYGMMNALFITLGWVSVLALPELWEALGPGWILILAAGGLLYTAGAIIVGVRRPDPWPDVFGYHEIWHVLVVLAVTLHYIVVAFAVLPMA